MWSLTAGTHDRLFAFAFAGITARLAQLESECQKQAQHVCKVEKLQTGESEATSQATAKQVQQLSAALERLDLQGSELGTQVQAELQAQQLLKKLSGVARGTSLSTLHAITDSSLCDCHHHSCAQKAVACCYRQLLVATARCA